MRLSGWNRVRLAGLAGFCAAVISAPLHGAIPAHPGMLNYVEGQASINGQQVTSKNVGSADVAQGEVVETGLGKVEVLLTPGIFLRLGDNSSLRVDSAGLTRTSLELLRGTAMLEATDLHRENNIQIATRGLVSTLEKNGLYAFDADAARVAVYDGKVRVQDGDEHVDLGKGRTTTSDRLESTKFDRNSGDELYRWSSLRSRYLSEASDQSARTYVVNNAGWYGGGWYWNPYYSFYSYLPGSGLLYSPFGYGFYSPWGPRSYYPHFQSGYAARPFVTPNRGFVGAPRAVSPVRPMMHGTPRAGGFGRRR